MTDPVPRRAVNLRWSWTDLTFSLSDRKLVIARRGRPELAHLTASWGHASGEVDVHLTFGHEAAMTGDVEKDHQSLFVVTPDTLRIAGEASERLTNGLMMPFVLRRHRRYRPGWLARSGYVVVAAGDEERGQLLNLVAPKARGKVRVDLRALVDPATHLAVLSENVFPPEILSHPEFAALVRGPYRHPLPVTAVRVRGGRVADRDTIHLTHGPDFRGVTGWCGIMNGHTVAFARQISGFMYEWLAPRVGSRHAEMLDRIVVGMALDEIDDLRSIIHSIGRFLRDPTNPGHLPRPNAAPAIR